MLTCAGVRGLEQNGTFVKFSVIGVYLENNTVPWLAAKWKGKTAEELNESNEFFTDIVTGNCSFDSYKLQRLYIKVEEFFIKCFLKNKTFHHNLT